MNSTCIKFLGFTAVFSFILSPIAGWAATAFDPNFLISDNEMRDVGSWTQHDVQNFLDSKGSYLRNYQTADAVDSGEKKAAAIIYDAAKRYEISPKVLLVTLQKEQSLVEDANPTQTQLDWATGYAVCDSCSTQDPKVAKHKGFATQIDDAAYTFDWYYDNKTADNIKQIGVAHNIDGQTVIPQTWATAFLYTYTPHLHGNQNFWNIWQKWFKQSYPNGTLLKSASTSEIWLVQDGVRRKFKNMSALITRADPKLIITVPDSQLANYQTGSEISFPNYSILKSASSYYLLDYDTLRQFASYDVVKKLGYNPQEILEVNSSDLAGLQTGKTITADIYAPQGVIYKISDFGNQLYLIKDGQAQALLSSKIAEANFKDLKIETKTMADLQKFTLLDGLIKFKDGTLIQSKNSADIYVIENGQKRKFENEQAFTAMGYNQNNIITVDLATALMLNDAQPIYYTASFNASELNKGGLGFLGDAATNVKDLYGSQLPAYLVAEYPSGQVVAGKNIDTPRTIASFVKVLVGYEALRQGLDYKKATTYDQIKHGDSGFSLWLNSGTKMTNKDILNTMLIGSYNNIARLTVEAAGLTEKQMLAKINERLKVWGTKNSAVVDVTGLDAKNVSTARELLKMFTYMFADSIDLQIILGKSRHDFASLDGKGFSISNTNSMPVDTKDYTILASKTGYTDEAQSVLYLLIESKKNKKRYSIITLGNPDYTYRFSEPARIASWTATKADLQIANY